MLFISLEKLFSFSRYLDFCLDFFVLPKNSLIIKIRLISTFITSPPGYQTIVIHILTNISRSKGNQTNKLGQLIEYNMRNIFLEKSFAKCDGETIPRSFAKKSKLNIPLDQQFYIVCFYFMPNLGLSEYIESKLQIT